MRTPLHKEAIEPYPLNQASLAPTPWLLLPVLYHTQEGWGSPVYYGLEGPKHLYRIPEVQDDHILDPLIIDRLS